MMRLVATAASSAGLAALLASAPPASAASPEDAYVAARDAALAKIRALDAKNDPDAADKAQDPLRSDLEKRLREIVGGLDLAGFPKEGALNLESLSAMQTGYGMLDGLRFSKGDNAPQIVVTTDGLFERWLKGPGDYWRKSRKTPPEIEAALHDDSLYTFTIGNDSAFSKTLEVPITKPDGAAFALALLGGWAQDIGPNPEQDIVVALRKDGKVLIESGSAEKLAPIPSCEKDWKAFEAKREKGKATEQQEERADAAYRACVGRELAKQPTFGDIVKTAQAIAEGLAKAGVGRK